MMWLSQINLMNVVAWFIPALLRHCEEHSDEAISEISTLRSQ
jgi:hypothetical protein